MVKFDGFIFDIDGTLASTNSLIFASFNHVAQKYLNKTLSDEEIIKLFGPTEDVILKQWMGKHFTKARKDYYKFYRLKHKEMASVFPGIIEIIQSIKSKRIPLAIYTGKGRLSTEITLKAIDLYDYFDLIFSGDDVPEPKPSPIGINEFINHFKLNKNNVLMIGDAPSDIIAARKAGIKIASVLWDSYAKEDVVKLNSDYSFNTVHELQEFIAASI